MKKSRFVKNWRISTNVEFMINHGTSLSKTNVVLIGIGKKNEKRYEYIGFVSDDDDKIEEFGEKMMDAIDEGYEATKKFFKDNDINAPKMDTKEEFEYFYKGDAFGFCVHHGILTLN